MFPFSRLSTEGSLLSVSDFKCYKMFKSLLVQKIETKLNQMIQIYIYFLIIKIEFSLIYEFLKASTFVLEVFVLSSSFLWKPAVFMNIPSSPGNKTWLVVCHRLLGRRPFLFFTFFFVLKLSHVSFCCCSHWYPRGQCH